ncbi:DNA cytosine methyltransferase [Neobacillus sp. DY30]|uniref:DNA cytosine methyltransferase n=1 Tax=Neobacillus sp. DY30 TaxID=3047871 RepID=UPI0024C0483C|nr:DNA cytosine methyltransferase [Neobacillus sp. DY30]WHY01860.1 DNA cytosine methyltransferase [Neobacillus sp. DY30]
MVREIVGWVNREDRLFAKQITNGVAGTAGEHVYFKPQGVADAVMATRVSKCILPIDFKSEFKDTWTMDAPNGKKVNSFFCGAGGFDLGFIRAGYDVAGAWDFDEYAVQSYRHNIGDHVQKADVSKMKGEDIPKTNGWLFGFPCQDISSAGRQSGMIKGVTRSGLFYEVMRLLGEVEEKPEWILAENVKGVSKLSSIIQEEYSKVGYTLVSPQLYNTKFWRLPQKRERYFLLGIRKDVRKSFNFPEQSTEFIPELGSVLETEVDKKYHINAQKSAEIIGHADGCDLTKYYVRKLTPREFARLQGFPESYEQVVSDSQFYKQMGNAVSVNVAYAIAKAIDDQL